VSPSASSPPAGPRPSLLLALVAAAIVAAHDPSWLSAPVGERARAADVRPERVSRVKGRVLAAVVDLVAAASRRGRPAAPEDDGAARSGAAEALLAVATSVLGKLRLPGRALQDELVAAFERVAREHGVSLRRFCAALALPERTLRSWRARPPRPPPEPEQPPEEKPRPRRGRFALGRADPFRGAPSTACAHLADADPRGARDRAEVAWKRWSDRNPDLGDAARRAVRDAFERTLAETVKPASSSTKELSDDILRRTTNRRPPPDPHLRN